MEENTPVEMLPQDGGDWAQQLFRYGMALVGAGVGTFGAVSLNLPLVGTGVGLIAVAMIWWYVWNRKRA